MKLSPTMQAALDMARTHGGRLERWPGGFWTYPACPHQVKNLPMPCKVPDQHVGAHTIHALRTRGLVRVSRCSEGIVGYPTEVEVVDAGS